MTNLNPITNNHINDIEKIQKLEKRIEELEKQNSFNTRFMEFLCKYIDVFKIDNFKDLIN